MRGRDEFAVVKAVAHELTDRLHHAVLGRQSDVGGGMRPVAETIKKRAGQLVDVDLVCRSDFGVVKSVVNKRRELLSIADEDPLTCTDQRD